MMATRVNPFENESYEQLIRNNLKGVINFDNLSKAVTPIEKDSKLSLLSDGTN